MESIPNLHLAAEDPFDIQGLVDAIKVHGDFQRYMESSAEVWEGYTVEEHSKMVLGMFEKYWARYLSRKEKTFWRVFLLLHDIGKPISKELYGNKSRQHETTGPVMQEIMAASEFSELELRQAKLLLDQDILGDFFKDKMTLKNATNQIVTIQRSCGWTIEKTLFNLKLFFCCDAGGYTQYAGGCYSLDYLFEVDEKKRIIDFTNEKNERPEYQEFTTFGKFQVLAASATISHLGSPLL